MWDDRTFKEHRRRSARTARARARPGWAARALGVAAALLSAGAAFAQVAQSEPAAAGAPTSVLPPPPPLSVIASQAPEAPLPVIASPAPVASPAKAPVQVAQAARAPAGRKHVIGLQIDGG